LDAIEARGRRALTTELAGDVTALAVSGDGATVAFVTADDGVSTLRLLDVATGAHRIAPGAPAGGVITDLRFAAGAPVVGFSFTDPARPRAAYTYELGSARLVRWTAATPPPAVGPHRELVASSAGVQVPLLAYLPRRARAPVVIDLHGGP